MIDSNIPKIPTVLAAAGFAVVLLLGFALNPIPAFANPPPHDHGGGGDDPVLFRVALTTGTEPNPSSPLTNWVVTDPDFCVGFTDGGLDAGFPSGCGPFSVQDIGSIDSLFLWLIEVKNTKTRMTVRLYFTSEEFVSHPENSTVYVTDFLRWNFIPGGEGMFTLDVNETNQVLTKIHQPDKGAVEGLVSVGNIVYTPM